MAEVGAREGTHAPGADVPPARVDQCYDAIPVAAGARVERLGPFNLFIREDAGWPCYARPCPPASRATIDDIRAVRARQRDLGLPEAFEWAREISPGVLPAARAAGLSVLLAPLSVLDPLARPPVNFLTDAHPTGGHSGFPC